MTDFNWTTFLEREKYSEGDLDIACKEAESYAPWLMESTNELGRLYTDFYRTIAIMQNIVFVHGDFSAHQKKAMDLLSEIKEVQMLELFSKN